MRLALVTHKLARGHGQGRVNYEIARAALAAGHTVWLVASDIAADLAAHPNARAVTIDVRAWPSALVRDQAFAIRAALWLVRHRAAIDVVHANGFVAWPRADVNTSHFVHAAWLASPYHTARVRTGAYAAYQWLYSRANALLERFAYRRAGVVVAVSRQIERELLDVGIARERLRVIANGVDPDEFKPAAASRAALDLPAGLLLLFVGDIKTPRKNLDTLLRALVHVPDATLAVAGATVGSPYPRFAAELGLAERVRFLGQRGDVPELMRAADVFVFPSRYEACSLVLLEAAASGLPVVAGRSTGGTELLSDECSVLVRDVDDAAELARALNRLAASPALRARMGAAARSVAEANTWHAMGRRYLELYAELHSERGRSAAPSHVAVEP